MASKPFFNAKRREWYIKYKPDPIGDWKREKLGKHTGKVEPGVTPKVPPKIEALARQFTAIEYDAKHSLRKPSSKAEPLGAYLDAYVAAHAGSHAAKSTAHVKRGVDRFKAFAKSRGVASVQGVTKSLCRDYLESRAGLVAVTTLRTERGFLMGAWTRAVEDELIPSNPWLLARVQGRAEPTAITFWSPAEVGRIADACTQPWQADFVLLLANTGLRVQTGLAVRWSWIGDRNVLAIRPGPNIKTTYEHTLSKAAREILDRRRSDSKSSLVFPRVGSDRPFCYSTIRDAIGRAVVRAGVRHGTPHDLRHSYGRALALAGVPVTVIQRQMGHTSLAMTMKYVTADSDAVGGWIERIDLASSNPPRSTGETQTESERQRSE